MGVFLPFIYASVLSSFLHISKVFAQGAYCLATIVAPLSISIQCTLDPVPADRTRWFVNPEIIFLGCKRFSVSQATRWQCCTPKPYPLTPPPFVFKKNCKLDFFFPLAALLFESVWTENKLSHFLLIASVQSTLLFNLEFFLWALLGIPATSISTLKFFPHPAPFLPQFVLSWNTETFTLGNNHSSKISYEGAAKSLGWGIPVYYIENFNFFKVFLFCIFLYLHFFLQLSSVSS